MTLKTSTRRTFMIQSTLAGAATLLSAHSQAQALVLESDPQAVAMNYKADAIKVDKTKQPKYSAGQMCGNCALFQGAAGVASGICPLFAGKQVSSKAWCSAYAKKG